MTVDFNGKQYDAEVFAEAYMRMSGNTALKAEIEELKKKYILIELGETPAKQPKKKAEPATAQPVVQEPISLSNVKAEDIDENEPLPF